MVKIRLFKKGRKHQAYYSIIAIDNKKKRDSNNFLEMLGFYDPRSKEIKLNKESIKKWIKVGAQPTLTVKNILKKNNILTHS